MSAANSGRMLLISVHMDCTACRGSGFIGGIFACDMCEVGERVYSMGVDTDDHLGDDLCFEVLP